MKRILFLCAVVATALAVPSAKADNFSISFDGGSLGYSGSGIFVGSQVSPGVFDITGVLSGSVTDPGFGTSSIVGVSSYAGGDNTLYYPNGGEYFDGSGLSFALANGVDINLFDDIEGSFLFEDALESNPNGDIPEFVTETVTPAAVTPEPSTFVLVGTSLVAAAGAFRRRFRA